MSTQLQDLPNTNIKQARFHGGDNRGQCIIIGCYPNHLELTREEAGKVAIELALFAQGNEVTHIDSGA